MTVLFIHLKIMILVCCVIVVFFCLFLFLFSNREH